MNKIEWICCKCKKVIGKIKGSMKHPYCIECFAKKFDSKEEYNKFLDATH